MKKYVLPIFSATVIAGILTFAYLASSRMDNGSGQICNVDCWYVTSDEVQNIIDSRLDEASCVCVDKKEHIRLELEQHLDEVLNRAITNLSMTITNELLAAKELAAEKNIQYELRIAIGEIRKEVTHSCAATVYEMMEAYAAKNRELTKRIEILEGQKQQKSENIQSVGHSTDTSSAKTKKQTKARQ